VDGASLDSIESFVAKWFEDHQWMAEDTSEVTKNLAKASVSTFARGFHSLGESFGLGLAAAGKTLRDTIKQIKPKPVI
jgi:hypothetical protein